MKNTSDKARIKPIWKALILAVVLPLILWYELEHYHAHSDTGSLTWMCAVFSLLINGCTLVRNIRKVFKKENANLPELICTLISLIVCIAVFIIVDKIPHCVECDHITTEELGFLSRWISGMDTP